MALVASLRGFSDPIAGFARFRPLPKVRPLPLVDEAEWALVRKLYGRGDVVRLDSSGLYDINRGEVNQSNFRASISADLSGARLIKGAEVGPFELRETMSQGEREWFDSSVAKKSWGRAHGTRIATQRITGVDERLRIVAALVEPSGDPVYFADSTNSIAPAGAAGEDDLYYLLGLLNSALYQWRFRLTSTNNNVGTGELGALPFIALDRTPGHPSQHIVDNARSLVEALRAQRLARGGNESRVASSAVRQYGRKIDLAVVDLFGLDESDVMQIQFGTGEAAV